MSEEMNEIINTTETEQTTEDFVSELDALIPTEDEETEESHVSVLGLGRDALAVWKAGELAVGAWKGMKRRIIAAEERKKAKEQKPSLKDKVKEAFNKKQTEETPDESKEESVEAQKSPFDGLTIEQIAAIMAQAEEAKQKQIAALEAQRAEIEERIKNAK